MTYVCIKTLIEGQAGHPKTFFCRLDCRSSRKLNPPDLYSFYRLENDKVWCLFKLVEIGLSLFACRKNKQKTLHQLIRFATSTCLVLKQHEVEVGLSAWQAALISGKQC